MLGKERVVLSAILIVLVVGTLVVMHTNSSTTNFTSNLQTEDPTYPPNFIDHLPFTINESGIYYLVKDLTVNGDGITILANNTVLIGQGHTITGNGTGTGIDISASTSSIGYCNISNFTNSINIEKGTSSGSIMNNGIYNNSIGVYFQGGTPRPNGYAVKDNVIINNNYGVRNPFSGENNHIYDNYLSNTLHDAWDDAGLYNSYNATKTSGPNIISGPWTGGNYWHDYTGTDSDGDGIGDTPYNIYGGNNKDYLPLVDMNPPEYDLTPFDSTLPNVVLNATWIDNVQVDRVILEFDGVNYTDLMKTGESLGFNEYYQVENKVDYSKSFQNVSLGTHYYRWFANDTGNNWNSTSLLSFNVTAVPLINSVNLSPLLQVTANITCEGVSNITQDMDHVRLHFSVDDNWFAMNMSYNTTTSLYSALIPEYSGLASKTIQYYIEALDRNGNTIASSTYSYHVPECTIADLNRDGRVDMKDIGIVARRYGKHT